MIKKILLLSITVIIINQGFGQYVYKDQLDPIAGIDIKYKVVHSKIFDKNSPVQLRLKLKNTNSYDANLKLEVEYSTGFTKKYKSGEFEICLPKNSTRKGKPNGLTFELNSTDTEIFKSEDADWEFIKFEVTQIESCRGKNQDN